MGNKFSRRRAVVDERYTRTQGLYQHRDVDPKKLKRLILKGQLAPCFPGAEDSALELDECPICFLFYPSLNTSKCCTKGICTECFLQIKSPHSARPTQCPFCKTSSYVVEYRGAKTIEEKGFEQAEEQKVIEAKIRIRQKELLDEEERMLRREGGHAQDDLPDRVRRNFSNLNGFTLPTNGVQVQGMVSAAGQQPVGLEMDSDPSMQSVQTCQPESVSEQIGAPQACVVPTLEGASLIPGEPGRLCASSFQRSNRGDNFDLDLEEIMVMEAIWLSIQEQSQIYQDRSLSSGVLNTSSNALNQNGSTENMTSVQELRPRTVVARSSVTSGLAGAIAALAERQAASSESIPTDEQAHAGHRQASENEQALPHLGDYNEPSFVNSAQSAVSPSATGADVEVEQNQSVGRCHAQETIPRTENSGGQDLNNWIEVSVENGRTISPLIRGESRSSMSDLLQDHSSEAVEVGTSFSSSVPSASDLPWEGSDFLPVQSTESMDEPAGMSQPIVMLPDSFEEQMMLAMALSLAEAQVQAR